MMWKLIDKFLIQITIIWFVVIFILCATPGQYIPSFSFLDLLSFDKFVHAFMFFTLSTLFFVNGLKRNKGNTFFVVYFLTAIVYGISLEIMQATIFINRSADWNDIIANTFGCILALVLKNKVYKFYNLKIQII